MADIIRRRPRSLRRAWDWSLWPFRRLLEDFDDDWSRVPELYADSNFAPAIDLAEKEGMLVLTAEVPGMAKDDLEVTVDNGVLTLRGEKKEEETKEGADYHRVERRYGHFERRIRLPEYVDTAQIEATYKDGVLELRMPKTEAAKAKTIKIQGD